MPAPNTPALAADCVVFNERGALLLIRRKYPPYQDRYALPGGFIDIGETTEHAARRELVEETGIRADTLRLIGVYSDPGRDPRRHVVSIAYLVLVTGQTPKAGDDAASAQFLADWRGAPLAFDHDTIVADALAML